MAPDEEQEYFITSVLGFALALGGAVAVVVAIFSFAQSRDALVCRPTLSQEYGVCVMPLTQGDR